MSSPYPIQFLDYIPESERGDLTNGVGVYCDDYLRTAIEHNTVDNKQGAKILFPRGLMRFAKTVNCKHDTHFLGENGFGSRGSDVTEWRFDEDVNGLVFNRPQTINSSFDDVYTTGCNNGYVEGILFTQDGDGTTGECMFLRNPMYITNCVIRGWPGIGIRIQASITATNDGALYGNANLSQLRHLLIEDCGSHGIYCKAKDSNACCGWDIKVRNCGGVGIYDSSFLGNYWFGCSVGGNTSEPFIGDDATGRGTFVGCTQEPGDPDSLFIARAASYGGNVSYDEEGSSGHVGMRDDGTHVVNPLSSGGNADQELSVSLGLIKPVVFNTHTLGSRYDLGQLSDGVWQFINENDANGWVYQITHSDCVFRDNNSDPLPAGAVRLDEVVHKNNADAKYSTMDLADKLDQIADHLSRIQTLET